MSARDPQRPLFSSLIFGAGFGAGWFLSLLFRVPLLLYLPTERQWTLTAPSAAIASDLYGRMLFAAACGGALTAAALALWRAPISPRALRLAFGWAAGTLAVALLFSAVGVLHHRYVPAPLPEHYVPR